MSILFQKDSAADWQARIIKELKGRPFEDLISKTRDGIDIYPFYTSKERASVLRKGPNSPWRIRQEFLDNDAENNALIHEALMAGVDSISVDAEHIEHDLEGVKVEMIEVEVSGEDFHPRWMEELDSRNLSANQVQGGYAWDPYGGMLLSGNFEAFEIMPMALKMMEFQSGELTNWYTVHVGGDMYHNAGATAVQELAFSLAQMNLYLKQESSLASSMALTMAAGTDYFETASKLRAMRILWANLMRTYKQEAELRLFARSSAKDFAPVDQHGNLLRATAQSMAAVAGGAERITVLPFDGDSNSFSYRMARNIQELLIHESYLDKALNPMEGAYLFEELTAQMATQAWDLFKKMESNGGWEDYALKGKIQEEVKLSAEQWAADINSGERTWLGVNKYPDSSQKTWKRIEVEQEGLCLPNFNNSVV